MLAGLLLALQDTDDRPGALTATLPFGGLTLIEYQARLLVAAGASQIVVVVARLTPELLGALSRIGRRGVAVDTVRSPAEAAEKVHPLARVVMLADGLTSTAATVSAMAAEDGDALLVVPDDAAGQGFERVGGGMNWAGIARLDPRRLGELTTLPRDYDVQSTLVRLASQAGATHVTLPADALAQGHGIEHSAMSMEARGRTMLAALVSTRRGWFDRLIVNPVARLAIVTLVMRTVPSLAVAATSTLLAAVALAALWFDRPVAGLLATIVAGVALSITLLLQDLRDEDGARTTRIAALVLPGIALAVTGYRQSLVTADHAAAAIAVALLVAGVLTERARSTPAATWWGTPPAYVLVVLLAAIAGFATIGLAAAAIYAAATLAAAIERLREEP